MSTNDLWCDSSFRFRETRIRRRPGMPTLAHFAGRWLSCLPSPSEHSNQRSVTRGATPLLGHPCAALASTGAPELINRAKMWHTRHRALGRRIRKSSPRGRPRGGSKMPRQRIDASRRSGIAANDSAGVCPAVGESWPACDQRRVRHSDETPLWSAASLAKPTKTSSSAGT